MTPLETLLVSSDEIGLSPRFQIGRGLDSDIEVSDDPDILEMNSEQHPRFISTADAVKLCDAMIVRWTAFRATLKS